MCSRVHGTGTGSNRTEVQGKANGRPTEGTPSLEGTAMSTDENPGWWREHLQIYMEKLWGQTRASSTPSSKGGLARGEAHPRQAELGGGARAEGKGNGEEDDRRTPQPTPYRRPQQSGEVRRASGEQTDEKNP